MRDAEALQRGTLANAAIAPRLYDVAAAAVYLSVGEDLVRELVGRGVLRRVRIPAPVTRKRAGGEVRKILLDRFDLDAQLEAWRER